MQDVGLSHVMCFIAKAAFCKSVGRESEEECPVGQVLKHREAHKGTDTLSGGRRAEMKAERNAMERERNEARGM